MDLTCHQQLPKLLLKGMYVKIINFKCPLQGCAFLASITYLILHLGNMQEILDFANMYLVYLKIGLQAVFVATTYQYSQLVTCCFLLYMTHTGESIQLPHFI